MTQAGNRLTIEEVKKHFDVWRETRPQGKRQAIPETLWEEVRQIAPLYTPSHIIHNLKMSLQQYRKHVEISVTDPSSADDIQFVEVQPQKEKFAYQQPVNQSFAFVIERRDGAMMHVNCQSTGQAQQLMQWFLG